jgi:hypothetical protein
MLVRLVPDYTLHASLTTYVYSGSTYHHFLEYFSFLKTQHTGAGHDNKTGYSVTTPIDK